MTNRLIDATAAAALLALALLAASRLAVIFGPQVCWGTCG